jgi:GxxExxY protein
VELKVAASYQRGDEAQLLNALKASHKRVGLIINFARQKVGFRRFIL